MIHHLFFTALYIAQLPMEMIVVAGDNVTIDCSPSDPIINVNITFSPLDTMFQELLTNAATYDIPSVTRSSSGTYECFGYAPQSDTFTTDFISTETVALTVLPGMGELHTVLIMHHNLACRNMQFKPVIAVG